MLHSKVKKEQELSYTSGVYFYYCVEISMRMRKLTGKVFLRPSFANFSEKLG